MTQEDKELLLRDLCTRLPYKVKLNYSGTNAPILLWDINFEDKTINGSDFESTLDNIRPYLRPMSSMTRKEKFEYNLTQKNYMNLLRHYDSDYLNAHHFDYRGLIEKGLALEAPEGIYETK